MDFKDNRKVLMDHYANPDNKGFIDDNNAIKMDLKSDSCSDELTVQISSDDKGIKDIHFEGSACVIATSPADILFNLLKGKSYKEARKIAQDYKDMIIDGKAPSPELKELAIFQNIHDQKNRWNCATLGVNGILKFLDDKNEK